MLDNNSAVAQAIANGTATNAGTLTGSEIVPASRGAGLLQTTWNTVADFVLGKLTFSDYTGLQAYTGGRTFCQIASTTLGGPFAKLASAPTVGANGGTIIQDGAGNYWQRLFFGQICAEWFGWVGGEPGAVLNAAQSAAQFHGIGYVTYSSPNYNQTTTINHYTGVVIKGPELGPQGVIRWKTGVAFTGHIQTPNFATQYVSQPTVTGVCYDYGCENVVFDGNCGSAQNVAPVTNPLYAGVCLYGARPRYRNVMVIRQPGIGVITAFTTTPTQIDFGNNLITQTRDGSYFENIVIEDTQLEGLVFQGPSDISLGEIRVGWPGNSLWNTAYSGKKSLLFPKGRLRRVISTAPGSGYTQAGTTWTLTTDATTPPTIQPVILSGGIDHWIVLTNGSADATYCTLTINGDGTGATATGYIGNWIVGALIYNAGAEFGFLHSYNNAQGPAIEVRNDDSGAYARFNADFIMGENSWGGVLIGDHTEYQIGRCDTHSNGAYGGPAVLPSLMITSDHGGMIANWKERRDLSSGNGALSLLLRGRGNVVRGRVQSNSGYAGNAILIGGIGNSVSATVQDINGFAVSTDYDIACASIRLVSNANQGIWQNYANAMTISSIDSTVDISAYGAVAVQSAYVGLNNFSSGQWKSIRIFDKRYDTGSLAYSSGTVSGSVDLTNASLQTLILSNPIVRIPQLSDCKVQVAPNTGATMTGLAYANVSAASATQLTVSLKLTGVGTGAGSALVTIA